MPRGRRHSSRHLSGRTFSRGMIVAPAAALAGAGAAFGQYAGPQYGQPVYEQPQFSQGYGGQTGEIAPPPAPAPLSPARRRVVEQQRAARPASRPETAAGPARISILGAVTKPRTFEFGEAPTLGDLVERAGGLTGASDRTLRVIRGGKPVAKVEYESAMAGRLAPGDVVVADAVPHSGPRERGVAHVALVGVAARPVVLAVPEGKANLATMLPMMGLDAAFAANVLVMNTTGARAPLPDGTVLAFPPGTETNQDWDAYGDLEPEPAAPAPTVADFAPIPPGEAAGGRRRPGPPPRPAGREPPRRRPARGRPDGPARGGPDRPARGGERRAGRDRAERTALPAAPADRRGPDRVGPRPAPRDHRRAGRDDRRGPARRPARRRDGRRVRRRVRRSRLRRPRPAAGPGRVAVLRRRRGPRRQRLAPHRPARTGLRAAGNGLSLACRPPAASTRCGSPRGRRPG